MIDVAAVRRRIDGRAEIVEELNDTFYGHRIFVVRDPNRFRITFAQIL
ncbi:MAG TPA: hypothetical protein VF603_07110 [Allosphingosinicella sp.]|jgi:uncharacterized glyoxalase superfamily protein PhnB